MELSVIIAGDKDLEKAKDTAKSALHYMSNQVLLVSDEKFSPENDIYFLRGFREFSKNVMLGLRTLVKKWPNSDWYCCMNSDCLVGSNFFKKDLKIAEKQAVWCMGNCLETEEAYLPLVELILKTELNEVVRLMGSCLFLHKEYVRKAMEFELFEKFLYLANDFPCEHNILDYLLPTSCKYWGGTVSQFAKWNYKLNMWTGNFNRYPMRQFGELSEEKEYIGASIMHPVTEDIRKFHKLKRERYAERRV